MHAYQHIIYVVCTGTEVPHHTFIIHYRLQVPPHQEVCIQVCACVCATCIHTCTVEDMYKKELIIFISYHCALVHLLVNVVSYSTGCVPKRNIEHNSWGGMLQPCLEACCRVKIERFQLIEPPGLCGRYRLTSNRDLARSRYRASVDDGQK